ncbi:cupin domain-containing protein [Pseudoalteromonas sp. JBTF-M23]|uniref:Cupin domain-containing protein n=1 Tax=Pseudoalteromonas caenipelagi TaxID=2726988 RepID=A0A849VD80_9GAMM|nr:iron-containing redox enzyme family protein [Pseudoalteromonas caenipelagi]NOU51362.1 cupin domain-containing protein [Pseudoalteromonas caenipelagi]
MSKHKNSHHQRIGERFESFVAKHPIWNNPLFIACNNNKLSLEDYGFVISQHFYYSRGFTRLLSALMMQCDNDYYRAELSHNLWEEAGEEDQENCHSNLLRRMITNTFGLDNPDATEFRDYTVGYFNDCLDYLKNGDLIRAAAFLGWGTEGVVPRIYSHFFNGLTKLGVPEEELLYLSLHMECDDEHSEVIEAIALDACNDDTETHWLAIEEAIDHSLTLRDRYFRQLYEELEARQLKQLVKQVTNEKPYADLAQLNDLYANVANKQGVPLYKNDAQDQNVSFEVTRFKVASEVIDPRLLEIPVGKRNEKHRHAHESVFYVLSGSGIVHVDEQEIKVAAGDLAYVPRWYDHYTQNTGDTPLKVLALTDYGFTRCFAKNTERSYRQQPDNVAV